MQSTAMPDCLTTLCQIAISRLMRAPNSAGVPPAASAHISAIRCLMSGAVTMRLISAFSFAITAAGVPDGAGSHGATDALLYLRKAT